MATLYRSVARNQRFSPARPRQRGASLIEQIMLLVIVASVAGMATPPLRRMLNHGRIQTAQSDLISALRYARETAVTSGRPTLLCPSVDGERCSDAVRWDSGWLLAHDADLNGRPDDRPFFKGSGYAGALAILSTGGRRFARFHPDGSASGNNLTLLLCHPPSAESALSVVIANSGRVRGAPATPEQAATCAQAR